MRNRAYTASKMTVYTSILFTNNGTQFRLFVGWLRHTDWVTGCFGEGVYEYM